METKNIIVEKTFEFALGVIEYVEVLEERRKYVIAKQLLKSGTSVGANTNEAQSAESKADFIHKFKIVDKEVKETIYWLSLCTRAKSYPNPPEKLMIEIKEIAKIVSKIIITSRRR